MTYAKRYARGGFTLMEIMIAIAILAIISAVVGPYFMAYLEKAKKSTAKTTLKGFKSAILLYQADVGQYPTTLKDLIRRPREERLAKKWEGKYIDKKEVPVDSWGNKYQYKVTPAGANPYELLSYGPKGKGSPKVEHLSVWDE